MDVHHEAPEKHIIDDVNDSTPQKTKLTIENPPFEDVSPIEHGDFPASHVRTASFPLKSYLLSNRKGSPSFATIFQGRAVKLRGCKWAIHSSWALNFGSKFSSGSFSADSQGIFFSGSLTEDFNWTVPEDLETEHDMLMILEGNTPFLENA